MLSRVLVLLACACQLVESTVAKKRQHEGCERLVQCSAALDNYFVEHEDLPTYLGASDEDVLNNFCERKSEQDQCLEEARDECDSHGVVAEVDATVAAAEYLCSDKGRQATLALTSSECATNEEKQLQVNEAIQSCLEKFEFDVVMLTVGAISENRDLDPTELCPFAESWTECTVAAAQSKCGDEYANFVSDILDVTAGPRFEQLGCLNVVNNKRQLLGRTLSALKRWVTKRGAPEWRK